MACRVDEAEAGVDVPASDDDDVAGRAVVFGDHGPGGAAAGVAGGFVRGEDGAAERHRFAIMQDAVDLRGRIGLLATVGEVGAAAVFDDGNVGVHDHVLAPGFA